jgi:outer membrane protein assembly factor BamB
MVVSALAAVASGPGLTDPEDDELVASNGRQPRRVDASHTEVFSLQWRRPMVRTGMHRTVAFSFGAPGLSKVHHLVIVGSGEGVVRGLSLVNGTEVWRYDHGNPFESSVAILDATSDPNGKPDELAILGSRDGFLLALETSTGELRWSQELDGEPRATVRRAGNRIIASTVKNQTVVLDLRTGDVVWSRGRPPPTGLTVTGVARATEQDGVVYAAYSDGYVEAYNLADGSPVWSRPLSVQGGEFVDSDADPILVDGHLVVASYSDGIYALNPADGKTRWKRNAPSVTSLAALDRFVVAASADGYVWGLTARKGEMVYRTRLAPGPITRLRVRDNLVATTAGDSGLVVLDGRSGKPLQASAFGDAFAGDLAWRADDAAFLAASGYLYALRLIER